MDDGDPKSVATLAEILNASWIALLLERGEVGAETPVGKLALKAIEYSELQRDYAERGPASSPIPPTNGDPKREGVLTFEDLIARLETTGPQRLVVTPVFDRGASVRDSGIDVRLGNQFIVFKRESMKALDLAHSETLAAVPGVNEDLIVKNQGEPLVLHPRQLVIGSTLEYVAMPDDLIGYVIGKSTWGRMGLIIATATKVDPGFRGCITLEIVNEGEIPLILYPGLPIAQLVFHSASSPRGYSGRYKCAVGPEYPKFNHHEGAFWTTPHK